MLLSIVDALSTSARLPFRGIRGANLLERFLQQVSLSSVPWRKVMQSVQQTRSTESVVSVAIETAYVVGGFLFLTFGLGPFIASLF